MLLRNNQILLGHRHPDPTKADSALHGEGTWTMPGGKLNFGETFEEGAEREVLEEIGVKIDKTKLKLVSLTNEIVPDAHFVTLGFLYENPEEKPKVMEPDEITEWHWFDLNRLPSPLYPPSQKIIKNYLAKEIYQPI